MESKEKVELIQLAIQQFMEEQREKKLSSSSDESGFVVADDDEDHHILLSRLLSQLETLKEEGKLQKLEPPADPKELHSPSVGKAKSETANEVEGGGGGGHEEIVKELKEVKRQNFITHCLLSVMIILTVGWQLSEVSLILKVTNGLRNPFKSFGDMLAGVLKGPIEKAQNGEKQYFTKQQQQQQIEGPSFSSLPPLKIPELLPHLDLPFGLDSDED